MENYFFPFVTKVSQFFQCFSFLSRTERKTCQRGASLSSAGEARARGKDGSGDKRFESPIQSMKEDNTCPSVQDFKEADSVS